MSSLRDEKTFEKIPITKARFGYEPEEIGLTPGDSIRINRDIGLTPAGRYQFKGMSGNLVLLSLGDLTLGFDVQFLRYCSRVTTPPTAEEIFVTQARFEEKIARLQGE